MSKIFRRWLIINLAVIGSVLVLGGVLLFYLFSDINTRAAAITGERNNFLFRSEGIKSLATLEAESKQSEAYLNELSNALPKEDELFTFTRILDRNAKIRNVNLNFAFGAEIPASGTLPPAIAFKMLLDGSYDSILKFLKDMESEKKFVEFSNFDITQAGGSAYGARINGKIFFRAIPASQ